MALNTWLSITSHFEKGHFNISPCSPTRNKWNNDGGRPCAVSLWNSKREMEEAVQSVGKGQVHADSPRVHCSSPLSPIPSLSSSTFPLQSSLPPGSKAIREKVVISAATFKYSIENLSLSQAGGIRLDMER